MKKFSILILSVLALTLILSGCGGGGGGGDDDSNSGKATYSLHIQDQTKAAMRGVVIIYKDPDGQSHNTAASDTSGNLNVIFKQAGVYPVISANLSDGTVIETPGMQFDISQDEINNNITKNFVVKIDMTDPDNPIIDYEKQATYSLHFQEQNTGAALKGVVINYSDPFGQPFNTEASDGSGNSTLTFDQEGVYPINSVTLSGGIVVNIPAGVNFEVPQDDIDNNITKKYRIIINTTSTPPELVAYDEI